MSYVPPSSPASTPDPVERKPLAAKHVLAIVAILLAAAVPIALQFGLDLCAVTSAVGVELDACLRMTTPVLPGPNEPADAGAP